MKTKICRQCDQEFAPTHHNHKYCAACRDERFNEQHPVRVCPKCGLEKRGYGRRSKTCWDCERRHDDEQADEMERFNVTKNAFLHGYEQLDIDQKERVLLRTVEVLFQRWREREAMEVDAEPINPEEVDAPDQAHIDAAFSELMEGIDL